MFIYSVYDVVSQEHLPIFEAKNDDVAIRDFKRMVSQQGYNPEDYKLFCHMKVVRKDNVIDFLDMAMQDITPKFGG
jgi:hypothetical protein